MSSYEERLAETLSLTRGRCHQCGQGGPARYRVHDGGVVLEHACPTHGAERTLVADDPAWFSEIMGRASQWPPDHQQPTTLVVDPGPPSAPLTPDEVAAFIGSRRAQGGPIELRLSGHEPARHPGLLALIRAARAAGVARVVLDTSGDGIAGDLALVRALAAEDVRFMLQLDALCPETVLALHGHDRAEVPLLALETIERGGARACLHTRVVPGINEAEIASVVDLLLGLPWLEGLVLTRASGRPPFPMDRLIRSVAEGSGGLLRPQHFRPQPGIHPLCFTACILLCLPGERPIALAGIVDDKGWNSLLADEPWPCCPTYPEAKLERILAAEGLVTTGRGRRRRPPTTRNIVVHVPMEAATWDRDRVAQCARIRNRETASCPCVTNIFEA